MLSVHCGIVWSRWVPASWRFQMYWEEQLGAWDLSAVQRCQLFLLRVHYSRFHAGRDKQGSLPAAPE